MTARMRCIPTLRRRQFTVVRMGGRVVRKVVVHLHAAGLAAQLQTPAHV